MKFGFDFHRTIVQQYFDKYFRGRVGVLTSSNGSGFLAGHVDGRFQYYGDSTRHTYENNFGFYAQDSFRVTPQLTLTTASAGIILESCGEEQSAQ